MPRVLLVDKSKELHHTLVTLSDNISECVIDVAESIDSALKLILSTIPDVVVTPVDMGERSGLEILALLRGMNAKIPVLFNTSFHKKMKEYFPEVSMLTLIKPTLTAEELQNSIIQAIDSAADFNLTEIVLLDYVKIGFMGQHSIRLQVSSSKNSGEIIVKNGVAWSARDRKGEGESAFVRLASSKEVSIELCNGKIYRQNIRVNMKTLLSLTQRMQAVKEKTPSFDKTEAIHSGFTQDISLFAARAVALEAMKESKESVDTKDTKDDDESETLELSEVNTTSTQRGWITKDQLRQLDEEEQAKRVIPRNLSSSIPARLSSPNNSSSDSSARTTSGVISSETSKKTSTSTIVKKKQEAVILDNAPKEQLDPDTFSEFTSPHKPSKPTLSKEAAKADSKETANADSKETANADSKETANAGSKETANAGSKETANAGSKETANAGSKETANAGSKETANAGSKEAAKTDSKDTKNKKASNAAPKIVASTPKSSSFSVALSEAEKKAKYGSQGNQPKSLSVAPTPPKEKEKPTDKEIYERAEAQFSKNYEAGIEALLDKKYQDAADAFGIAIQLKPEDEKVLANITRLKQLGYSAKS